MCCCYLFKVDYVKGIDVKFKKRIVFAVIFSIFLCLCGANIIFCANGKALQSVFADETLPTAYCIRDEYILPTQNQSAQNLCWDFALSTSLSNAIMKRTNQYIDVSEAYISNVRSIAIPDSNYPGGPGSFPQYNNRCRDYGVVLEQDFNYETSFWMTKENNNDFYNFYKNYADLELIKNYERVGFNTYRELQPYERYPVISAIKSHIYNYGSVMADCKWQTASTTLVKNGVNKVIYYKKPVSTTNSIHSISIIGWDDEISIVFNNKTYTGAWIILNSYGSTSGTDGVFYLMYDDGDVYAFMAYKYTENPNCNFEITSVNSNAVCNVNFKGKYYGNLEAETAQTKQKNIFYNTNNIALNYDYKANNGYSIKQIDVYNLGTDVTSKFNVSYSNNSFSIASSNCDIGAYKVKITLTNGEEEIFSNTAFYVCDGNEIESITYASGGANLSTGQGTLQCAGNLNTNAGDLIYYSSSKTGILYLSFTFSTYSSVSGVSLYDTSIFTELVTNNTGANISYDLDQNNAYSVIFKHDDVIREYKIYIFYVEDPNSEIVVLNYDLNGGVNNSQNLKRGLISNSKNIELYEPTREGYVFKGWYTSPTFEESSKLNVINDKYVLKNSDVIRYDTNTVGYQSSFNQSIKKSNVSFLYANWEKIGGAQPDISDGDENSSVAVLIVVISFGFVVGLIATVSIVQVLKSHRIYRVR